MGVEEHGRWLSDTVFEFNELRELGPGLAVKTIDVSMLMTSDPDLTPEMVIEVLIDSNGRVEEAEPEEMVKVRCPDCGRLGLIPADALRRQGPAGDTDSLGRRDRGLERGPGRDVAVMLRCPPCWDKKRN